MLDRIPKVFISYSWVKKQETISLAEKLRAHRIDVVLDVWDLKPGQDKYFFMEQCVTNPEIDKVIMICDKSYTEKANERRGGVGDETMIISPEIYEKATQEKFIPVVIELNDDGKPFLPAYLKNRIYIDISGDNFEDGYEQLVRTIYEQPEIRKPELGELPDFLLREGKASVLPLKDAIRKLSYNNFSRVNEITARDFLSLYLNSLRDFYKKDCSDPNIFLEDFSTIKEHRDYFLKFLTLVSESKNLTLGAFMAEAFEYLYNTLCDLRFFAPHENGYNTRNFDIFKLHIWELFLCTTTYMLHNELFSDIHDLLVHTYFLRNSALSDKLQERSYGAFYFNTYELDSWFRQRIPRFERHFTPLGHILCTERDYLPICTGRALAETDLFLFQIYDGLDLGIDNSSWYPTCYIYADTDSSIWQKLKSKRFCQKIFKLFDVNSVDSLRQQISNCRSTPANVYQSPFHPALPVKYFINVQEIGVLP